MKKIKVLCVFGTRPEAIKMAPLIKELEKSEKIINFVCVTAQHREMLDQVLNIFDIKPDFDLNIMREVQTLTSITTLSIAGVDNVLQSLNPDIVLVHGDTTTTFSASIAAFYNKIPVGHVEAGLRTYDKYSPYPEEMNRRLTGNIAEIHFAPTIRNKNNLKNEGIEKEVFVTGNTVIDSLKYTINSNYRFKNSILSKIDFTEGRFILLTAHRRENLGSPMENICRAAKKIVDVFKDVRIIFPVHLNPKVQKTAQNILADSEKIYLIDPIDVQDMHNLMNRSYLVMTDSGGLQEEAPALGKPVVVLRIETERPEAVEAGTVKIAGIEENSIYKTTAEILSDNNIYTKMAKSTNPYGDGKASERIVKAIIEKFTVNQ